MPYYCHYQSAGSLPHTTNLQLYSLKQAANSWNPLVNEFMARGEDGVYALKERQAFVVNCLGLSLSQLLGQNSPCPEKERMDQPRDLLKRILERSHVDRTTRHRLNRTFQDFLAYYGSTRHFGKNKDEKNYRTMEKLTMQQLDRFRRMTIEVWDTVIAMNPDNEQPICQYVWFNNLPENVDLLYWIDSNDVSTMCPSR
jgi:hypothetical protein